MQIAGDTPFLREKGGQRRIFAVVYHFQRRCDTWLFAAFAARADGIGALQARELRHPCPSGKAYRERYCPPRLLRYRSVQHSSALCMTQSLHLAVDARCVFERITAVVEHDVSRW